MGYWQHDRTYDHRGTEDCTTVVLSADIGRYAAGTLLCDVLEDLIRRVSNLQTDYTHGFHTAGLNAFLAPYSPGTLGGSLLGVYGLDAVVAATTTPTFGIDAEIEAYSATETVDFGIWAYIQELEADGVTTLAADIDDTQTVITVTSAAGFPTGGDYAIQIDGETMLVVGGQGTTTWTVIRGDNATAHVAGTVVVTC